MSYQPKEIIERCEQVRCDNRLSKTAFSASFGMKPQTYNNFIGGQGSKPSVELIAGIAKIYGIAPAWLLFGEGEVLKPKAKCAAFEVDTQKTWINPYNVVSVTQVNTDETTIQCIAYSCAVFEDINSVLKKLGWAE